MQLQASQTLTPWQDSAGEVLLVTALMSFAQGVGAGAPSREGGPTEPRAGSFPGAHACYGSEELVAELNPPALLDEAPAMPSAGAGSWELTMVSGAHRSWPVPACGSGHTQLHSDQGSHNGPGHPSANAQHSQALPGQVCRAPCAAQPGWEEQEGGKKPPSHCSAAGV